jgi:hypothetical protein
MNPETVYNFEWNPAKALHNVRKHDVTFDQAAAVFLDALALTVYDEETVKTKIAGSHPAMIRAASFWQWLTVTRRLGQPASASVSFWPARPQDVNGALMKTNHDRQIHEHNLPRRQRRHSTRNRFFRRHAREVPSDECPDQSAHIS